MIVFKNAVEELIYLLFTYEFADKVDSGMID